MAPNDVIFVSHFRIDMIIHKVKLFVPHLKLLNNEKTTLGKLTNYSHRLIATTPTVATSRKSSSLEGTTIAETVV